MSQPPIHLLEDLSSIDDQRKYIVHATVDKYLLPEELLNDAYAFCDWARGIHQKESLPAFQKFLVDDLFAKLESSGDFLSQYDRSNIEQLVERDEHWVDLRRIAGQIMTAFMSTA